MNFLQRQRLRKITQAAYSSGEWAEEPNPFPSTTSRFRWVLDPLTALAVGLGFLAMTLFLVWGTQGATYEDSPTSSSHEISPNAGEETRQGDTKTRVRDKRTPSPGKKLQNRGFTEQAMGVEQHNDNEHPNASQEKIIVHVAGAVKDPGIVILPKNARVFHAIDQAGGSSEQGAPQSLNLAAHLNDGDFIYVPTREEASSLPSSPPVASGMVNNATAAGDTPRQQPGECVNINTGNAQELQRLPGVGPALSQRILDYRKENGNFTQIEDLDAVSGIGMGMINRIRSHVCS